MKILHVCETAKGGVGTYINTLATLERGLCDTKVVLPQPHQSMITADVPRQTFAYPQRSFGSMWRLVMTALRERFRYKPDIIFCHSTFALLPLVLLRVVSPGTRFIYCAHGWAGTRETQSPLKARLTRLIEGTLWGQSHRVVNVSKGEMQFARRNGYLGRHIVVENAVFPAATDTRHVALDGPDDAIHLLFVGRLDHQKGLDILLRAFAEARKTNPALKLHVIGEAVVSDADESGSRSDLPVEGVDFLGWISADRIDTYYAAADLVVVPSRWEGLPLVVPEALRNGTPVLVSDRSDMPSLIEPLITGFWSSLGVGAFTATLINLQKDQLAAMRPAYLTLFNVRFRSDRLGRDIMALYRELLGK